MKAVCAWENDGDIHLPENCGSACVRKSTGARALFFIEIPATDLCLTREIFQHIVFFRTQVFLKQFGAFFF